MHQFMQVIGNRVSISEDPQAKKKVGIANTEDNCILLSGQESVVATFSLTTSRYVQPGLFKSLVWVVAERN